MTGKLRIFTVAEANALVPQLTAILARQLDTVASIEATVERLRARVGPIAPDLRPAPGDPDDVAGIKSELRALIAAFRQGWDEIDALGGVVKDMKTGLVDFYGERDGQLVWLCWRYGEARVAHWHPLDKGFGARQPIDQRELLRALN